MKKYLFAFLMVATVSFLPDLALAQGGFVPCSGNECGTCHVISMANEIITWLIGFLFVVFAAVMAVAGFGLVTSGGNRSALDAAKSKFQNGIIGIILVLAAWLIVDTLLRGILNGPDGTVSGYGPWTEVTCTVQATPEPWNGDPFATDAPPDAAKPTGPLPTSCSGGTGGTCAALGIPCKSQASCTISPDLVAKLQAFHRDAAVNGAWVSEAMPPTRTHKSACHTNGTCIDYSKPGGMSSAEVVRTINSAKANGLRPVYEVQTKAQKDALVASGAPASNIMVLGNWISAPHFSIYGY